jgi:hypothetical protein
MRIIIGSFLVLIYHKAPENTTQNPDHSSSVSSFLLICRIGIAVPELL